MTQRDPLIERPRPRLSAPERARRAIALYDEVMRDERFAGEIRQRARAALIREREAELEALRAERSRLLRSWVR